MPFDLFLLYFSFAEERKQVQKAILSCYLTGGNKEAFEDELESEDDEEE